VTGYSVPKIFMKNGENSPPKKKKKRKKKDWVTLPHASKNPIKRTNYKPAENDEEPCI
jgi:hypothetical protein